MRIEKTYHNDKQSEKRARKSTDLEMPALKIVKLTEAGHVWNFLLQVILSTVFHSYQNSAVVSKKCRI